MLWGGAIGIIVLVLYFLLMCKISPSDEGRNITDTEYDKEQQKLIYPSNEDLYARIFAKSL